MKTSTTKLSRYGSRLIIALTLVVMMCILPSLADAQTRYELSGDALRVSERTMAREVPLGCTGAQLFVHDGLFVVCTDGRVRRVVLDAAGDVVSDVGLAGPVLHLFVLEGALWARTEGGVVPITGLTQLASAAPAEATESLGSVLRAPSEPAAAEPAPFEPQQPSDVVEVVSPSVAEWAGGVPPPDSWRDGGPLVARVIRVQGGHAIVEILPGQHLREDMGVELSEIRASGEDLELGGSEEEEVTVSRGVVVAASSQRARVRIEVGGRATVGMLVRRLRNAPGVRPFPELPEDTVTLGFHIRPFLPIGILGVGVIADVSVRYQSSFGLYVGADLMPGGFGTSNNGEVAAVIATAYVGFAMRWFGFGVGVGPATANGLVSWRSTQGAEALAIAPNVRIGSEDGFMLRARTIVLAWDDLWHFGDLQVDLRIPVSHGIQLVVTGRGGNSGSQLGEAGVRLLLDGNGRSGSLFFTGTVGVGMLVAPNRCSAMGCTGRFANGGPLLGAGIDWRI